MSGTQLRGKTALITGSASGIGRATALLFAREGAAVSMVDLNEEAGQEVALEISNAGGRAIFEPADVTCAADCRRVVERAVREFGGIHILFNNAGIIRRASVVELSEADWDAVMAVNVKSIFLMSPRSHSHHGTAPEAVHHQHGFRLGSGGRAQSGRVLRFERRGGAADQGHGDRSRAAEYSRKLHLPRRHRHRHAAQRGAATGRAGKTISGGVGKATAGTRGQAGGDRASGACTWPVMRRRS